MCYSDFFPPIKITQNIYSVAVLDCRGMRNYQSRAETAMERAETAYVLEEMHTFRLIPWRNGYH